MGDTTPAEGWDWEGPNSNTNSSTRFVTDGSTCDRNTVVQMPQREEEEAAEAASYDIITSGAVASENIEGKQT